MIAEMVQGLRELLILLSMTIFSKVSGLKAYSSVRMPADSTTAAAATAAYCLSWRLAAEANNVRAWRTVPNQCWRSMEIYMTGGQYQRDVEFVVEQIMNYANEIVVVGDGLDAWVLDIDDTCISNALYYRGRRYGCDPFDRASFMEWALKGVCPAIPAVLGLFKKLVGSGFKVFLVTGRDQETLGQSTLHNLHAQGFLGYERLIMRTAEYKGKSAVVYKSEVRKKLVGEGYRIWGNVGDQWTDLQGDCVGDRTFKIPNSMYYVP